MIQLHPRSLLVGLVLGAIALLTMSQSLVPSTATVRVQYMPHPRDMVQIEEGVPYTVPVGKVFVLTGLGTDIALQYSIATLEVDDVPRTQAVTSFNSNDTGMVSAVAPVPPGFTVDAGHSISVTSGQHGARAWGYLADQ